MPETPNIYTLLLSLKLTPSKLLIGRKPSKIKLPSSKMFWSRIKRKLSFSISSEPFSSSMSSLPTKYISTAQLWSATINTLKLCSTLVPFLPTRSLKTFSCTKFLIKVTSKLIYIFLFTTWSFLTLISSLRLTNTKKKITTKTISRSTFSCVTEPFSSTFSFPFTKLSSSKAYEMASIKSKVLYTNTSSWSITILCLTIPSSPLVGNKCSSSLSLTWIVIQFSYI